MWEEAVTYAQDLLAEWRRRGWENRDVRLVFRALQREWYTQKPTDKEKQEHKK